MVLVVVGYGNDEGVRECWLVVGIIGCGGWLVIWFGGVCRW